MDNYYVDPAHPAGDLLEKSIEVLDLGHAKAIEIHGREGLFLALDFAVRGYMDYAEWDQTLVDAFGANNEFMNRPETVYPWMEG